MSEKPEDPITPLLQTAHMHHELFLAWRNAGFTEAQALALLQSAVAAAFSKGA